VPVLATCNEAYRHYRQQQPPRLLSEPVRDKLWQGFQCGLTVAAAETYARQQSKVNDPGGLKAEVAQLRAVYDKGCQDEYKQIPAAVQTKIGNAQDYQRLRPLTLQAVPEPLVALLEIGPQPFLGVQPPVLATPKFGDFLREADHRLQADFERQRDTWAKTFPKMADRLLGFQWRERAGSRETFYTNHMLGRALDIDAETNPIFTRNAAQAVDEILSTSDDVGLLDALVPGGRLTFGASLIQTDIKHTVKRAGEAQILKAYERMQKINGFLMEFLRPAVDKRRALLNAADNPSSSDADKNDAAKALRTGRDIYLIDQLAYTLGGGTTAKFATYHDHGGGTTAGAAAPKSDDADQKKMRTGYHLIGGFLLRGLPTVPYPLVYCMIKAGLKWGGEYNESKDPMHFEDPATDPDPPKTPTPCQQLLSAIWSGR
jgi:hypothetical protein